MDKWINGLLKNSPEMSTGKSALNGFHLPIWCYSSDKTILTWQLRLRIGPAEPRALGVNRRIMEAVWATASLITRRSVFMLRYSCLCDLRSSALAIADLSVLATIRAPLRGTTA